MMALLGVGVLMVNSMHQHAWAMGNSDIWPSIILGESVRLFLCVIGIYIGGLCEKQSAPHVDGPCPIS